jgi:repressor LexA
VAARFTARQGQFLAFIHGFTVKRGCAPSFEQIGAHFGVTAPSVNSMIKMLERRGLLSRLPGVARSLRVLVPAEALPGSEFDSRATERQARGERVSSSQDREGEVAGTVAIAVLDAVMPCLGRELADLEGGVVVRSAAHAVYTALLKSGLTRNKAADVAKRVGSEAARWESPPFWRG